MNKPAVPLTFKPWEDPQETPLISFKGVTKRFGSFTAIDNVTLDIYHREFFALLGPSGCGKTTLMRMLGGFETPSEGQITIDSQNMSNIPPNKRAVNMMFQSYALFPHLSVWDNIAFGLKRDKLSKDQIAARVEEMINLVKLNKFEKRRPHQISGGQRQRVALARSLAKAPKLLLLDEPLGALDKKLRQDTQFELMDIQENTGTTFVIVTHDQEEAMTVASRIAVMDHGELAQVEVPAKIYETPNCVYVANFIGDVNLIEGNAKLRGDGKAELSWAEGQPALVTECPRASDIKARCTFAIRPEKVNISKERHTDCTNVIRGEIHDIAYLGNISTYKVKLSNGTMIRVQTSNNRRIARRELTWGDDVWLSWTETAGIVLDR